MQCLSDETVARFAEGRIDGAGMRRANRHLDRCPSCRQLVACLARHSDRPSRVTSPLAVTNQSLPVAIGDALGRYRVEGYIGGGAMGVVYRARDPELGRPVAVKLVRPSCEGPEAQTSLEEEARALAGLSHPNIVSVFDVGSVGGLVYLVMELVEGPSMSGWLAQRGRSRQEILGAFDQLARGLAAMHAAGLVHRDVKPANVLVAADGRVMVSDFGLVHRTHDESITNHTTRESNDSSSGPRAVGTPAYMAPEQLRGEPATAASDQFSFFVALFEALCGQSPFPARSTAERYHRIVQREIAARGVALPGPLRRVLRRGLAPKTGARFASMDAVRHALTSSGRRWGVAALGLVAVVGFGAATIAPTTDGPDCAWINDARAWDADARSDAHAAFGEVELSYAVTRWQRADRVMTAFDATWPHDAEAACHASGGRAAPCLRDQHRRVRTVAELLQTVDQASLDEATHLAESLPSAEVCADVEPDVDRSEEPSDVKDAVARAAALLEVRRFEQAEVEASTALDGALTAGSPRLASQARFHMGRAKSRQGQFSEAVLLLERAYWAALDRADAALAGACALELSYVAMKVGDLRGSASWAKSVRAELDRLPTPDPVLETSLDMHWAAHHWHLEEFDKAAKSYQLAERHLLETARPRPLTHALVVYGQGTVFHSQGDFQRALEEYRRAIAIVTEEFGPEHPGLAEMLNGEGLCLARIGEWEQANEVLRRALDIVSHPEANAGGTVGRIHTNLADTFAGLGALDEADEHFDQALAVFVPTNGPPLREAFIVYLGKARLARMREDYGGARRLTLEAGAFCERRFGSEHSCSGDVALDLALTAILAKDYPEALRHALRAREIRERVLGPGHPLVAIALRSIGDAHLLLEQPDEAAEAYQAALELMRKAGDHERTGPMFSGLAEAHLARGRLVEAEAAARAGLDTPLAPDQRGMVALVLAKVVYARGRQEEAFALARDARADMVELGPHMQVYIEFVDEWQAEVQ